jgi:hypothetical protein
VLFPERPEALDCLVTLRGGLRRLRGERLERLENDILGILKLPLSRRVLMSTSSSGLVMWIVMDCLLSLFSNGQHTAT